ncbi:MAG: hypothetical protein KIT84_01105 [Labilithrix sp.]|nr:hypothetical protein [Labilithrix sp.]MCW5809583.1 hypothetical protein [Labilithrix sp.]
MSRLALLALALGLSAVACAAETDDDAPAADEGQLQSNGRGSDHWFYSGPLPALENPSITTSLEGHTVRVTGFLPAGARIPELPHVKTKAAGGRTQLDIVYPIATAMAGKADSQPRTYSFYHAKPYRPNGNAYTVSQGNHFVTWGGFPFLGYNDGIAFHGPITDQAAERGGMNVWYLRRGDVSSGCNRMMGEHVVELAHVIGINMRKVYKGNYAYEPTTTAKVKVITDFDQYEGQWIDVDYPTDVGASRPAVAKQTTNVAMFGSWVATTTPDGKDLPPDMKWEGGVNGQWYDFQEHAIRGNVCSMPPEMLEELKTVAARTGGVLPADFCQKKFACDDRKGKVCRPSEI